MLTLHIQLRNIFTFGENGAHHTCIHLHFFVHLHNGCSPAFCYCSFSHFYFSTPFCPYWYWVASTNTYCRLYWLCCQLHQLHCWFHQHCSWRLLHNIFTANVWTTNYSGWRKNFSMGAMLEQPIWGLSTVHPRVDWGLSRAGEF